MNDSWYDTAQICINGHVINSVSDSHPEHNKKFCDKCGAPTITNCQKCNKPVPGYCHVSEYTQMSKIFPELEAKFEAKLGEKEFKRIAFTDTLDYTNFPLPTSCSNCGEPYPWTEEKPTAMKESPPKAFIAHEGITRALQKVKDFLDTLGVQYLIAEIEPSNGRVVEGQVQWTQRKADFAIILATKGKIIDKETGKPQMGLNVADELGRAREVFKNRIILLLQKGVEPYTNVSGIVYEPFTTQNMENVFKKIVKEIRNWGYI